MHEFVSFQPPTNEEISDRPKKCSNRFRFCDEGTQTTTVSSKVQRETKSFGFLIRVEVFLQFAATMTEPIVRRKFAGLANQRIIFQEYSNDFDKQVGRNETSRCFARTFSSVEKRKRSKKNEKLDEFDERTKFRATKNFLGRNRWKTSPNESSQVDRTNFKRKSKQNFNSQWNETRKKRRKFSVSFDQILNISKTKTTKIEIRSVLCFRFGDSRRRRSADRWRVSFGRRNLAKLWSSATDCVKKPTRKEKFRSWRKMFVVFTFRDDRSQRVQGAISLFKLNDDHPDVSIRTESSVVSLDFLSTNPWAPMENVRWNAILSFQKFDLCRFDRWRCYRLRCVRSVGKTGLRESIVQIEASRKRFSSWTKRSNSKVDRSNFSSTFRFVGVRRRIKTSRDSVRPRPMEKFSAGLVFEPNFDKSLFSSCRRRKKRKDSTMELFSNSTVIRRKQNLENARSLKLFVRSAGLFARLSSR